ncbi:MAG TPA: septum site-determining protein MinC [Gemmataceae bacterium]|jgi:septum site-determining protein MinC|nr:septum site-determining protein MinC [Gemmataceae bacterium]
MTNSQRADVNGHKHRTAVAPFQVRGRFFTAIVLQMTRGPDAEFFQAVDALVAQTPHFFSDAPFVLDLDRTNAIGASIDFIGLTRELRKRKVMLIGVQNGTIEQNRAALTAGLITLPGGYDTPPDANKKREGAPKEDKGPQEPPSGALLVTDPVRSGQRIFADTGDLVVVASVSSGAELIARGNIHVYGRMRGRALAGVNGDSTARIFCQSLEAELIAIAGLYKTSDTIESSFRNQRVQAFLEDGTLRIRSLK